MNRSLTGHAAITDLDWLTIAAVPVGLLLAVHLALRLARSDADELVLPVAALLAVVGLLTVYVWEARDANAYVSTVALPALREYKASVADELEARPASAEDALVLLGSVPSELEYEDASRGRFATVLDPGWRRLYDETVRRVQAAEAATGRELGLPVRPLRLHDALHRQLLALGLGLLLVPLVLVGRRRLPLERLRGTRVPILAASVAPIALLATTSLTSGSGRLPPLLRLGGQSVTIYALVVLALVGLLALTFAPAGRSGIGSRTRLAALGAVTLTVAWMAWRDPGAGAILLCVAALMVAVVGRWRLRLTLLLVGAALVATMPLTARLLDGRLPDTVRVRMEMWTDPWGSYERAQVRNQAASSLGRLATLRPTAAHPADVPEEPAQLTVRSPPGPSATSSAVERIEQELRWRLDALDGEPVEATPLVPEDALEELLLLEAERLWTELGGHRPAARTPTGLSALHARVDDAIEQLEAGAARLDARSADAEPQVSFAVPDNFQLQRSLFALREGGALGVGLGLGLPETIPDLTEDVAVAALGESLGLAGILLVVALVLLLAGRGIQLASSNESHPVRALLLVGLSSLLGVQALVNLGGVSGVLPFTGLTFPFVSRSGTGLVASFVALALVMACAPRPVAPPAPPSPARARALRWLLGPVGLPAAFAFVLGGIALLQLSGRTLMTSPMLASLPGPDATFLHASDQWVGPGYWIASGPIIDRDGQVLARTRSVSGDRVFPDDEVATALSHTLRQLDLAFAVELKTGTQTRSSIGPTLVTEIDADVQRALHWGFDRGARAGGVEDIARLRGAAVLVDVNDGGIVALESRPSFAVSELADPEAWAQAEAQERREGFSYRHLNRVLHGLYPPGSAFKTVTAAAVLDLGLHTVHSPDFDYRAERQSPDGLEQTVAYHELRLADGPPITDANHPHVADWLFDLEEAFAYSDNVAFAQMGLQLGPEDLVSSARRFGFEQPLGVRGFGGVTSTLDRDPDGEIESRFLAQTDSAIARTAFGQAQVQSTPLQMALVAAAIANGGTIMQPRLVAGWQTPTGAWLTRYPPRVLSETELAPSTVAGLQEIMQASVTYGIAQTAAVAPGNVSPGVAGKTGSAEWSDDGEPTHSWFIGYFPTEAPRLALAVVVEKGGPGPQVAARIARQVFQSDEVRAFLEEEGGLP